MTISNFDKIAIIQVGNDMSLQEKINQERDYYSSLGYESDYYWFDCMFMMELLEEVKYLAQMYKVVIIAEPLPPGLDVIQLKQKLYESGLASYVKQF